MYNSPARKTKNTNYGSPPPKSHKYDVNSNGSPVNQKQRKFSNDKLLRAPMKANCVDNTASDLLFDDEQPIKPFSVSPPGFLSSPDKVNLNDFSYDSPLKIKKRDSNFYCDSTDYTARKKIYENATPSKLNFNDFDDEPVSSSKMGSGISQMIKVR